MTAGRIVTLGSENTREHAQVEPGQFALRVYQVNSPGGGGGTEYAEDSAHNSGDAGTQVLAVRNDTPGSLVDTDGDYASLQLDDTGRLRVAIDNTPAVTVSGTVDVSGSAVTIQEPLSVDDNGGSLTVDGTVAVGPTVTPGTGATNLGKAEDAAHSSGATGVMALAVRNDAGTALAGTTGDYIPLSTDNVGRLRVNVGATIPGTGTTNLGKAEDAVHNSGATGVMALAVRNDTPSSLASASGDYIPLTTDSEGKLHVQARQATRTNLLTNSSLQLQGVDVVAGAAIGVSRTVRVPVQNYGLNSLPQLTFSLGVAETFGVSMVDPSAINAAGVNAAMGGLSGTGGGLRTGPDRDTYVSLFSGQVFNNVTTAANSSSLDVSTARWAVIFIDLAESGTPTDIRLIAQFSPDSGSTWYDYAVDQWVDLRYVDTQMPLTEVIPLNYVIPGLFRLRAVATGTTASDTFTLSADIQVIS